MGKWLTAKEIRDELRLSSQNLYNYTKNGNIKTKIKNGKKFYLLENDNDNENRINITYSRVSNTKQKDDLIRQEKLLKEFAISNGNIIDETLSDIASGMNEDRKGFNKLLKLVLENKVNKVFITYKDRLSRFGFEYFKYIFSLFNTEIIIVNLTKEEDYQTELTEDIISILHHFSMKMYSNRRKDLKKIEKDLKNDENI